MLHICIVAFEKVQSFKVCDQCSQLAVGHQSVCIRVFFVHLERYSLNPPFRIMHAV